jgi:hypothetical protein
MVYALALPCGRIVWCRDAHHARLLARLLVAFQTGQPADESALDPVNTAPDQVPRE